MVRRGSGLVAEKILNVLSSNPSQKMSIQEISKLSDVSWESTKRYLEFFVKLKIVRTFQEDSKLIYQKIRPLENDTLFSIPLSQEHKDIIRKIYGTIKNIWKDVCSEKPLTKTLIQKIAVEFISNNPNYKDIPRGWYLYGQSLLLPFDFAEDYQNTLESDEDLESIKQKCIEYEPYAEKSHKIRRHHYENKNNSLYLLKENLSYCLVYSDFKDNNQKNKIRKLLNDFAVNCERKESNSEILAIVEDFCSETLAIFRHADNALLEKSRQSIIEAFGKVWQLVATYEFYDSLKEFYDKELLQDYLFDKIKALIEMVIESLENLQEFRPKFEFPNDEITQKLKSLMGSAKELTLEEKKARKDELEKIKSEKGEEVLDKFLSDKTGLKF